jgi:hypothetical protein
MGAMLSDLGSLPSLTRAFKLKAQSQSRSAGERLGGELGSCALLFTKGAKLCARLSGRGVQAYLRLESGTIVTSDFNARQGSLGLA